MSLDCTITIPAGGSHGSPRTDRTGPLSQFITDNEVHYRAISKHLKECGTCDPREILERFLENRFVRMHGRTSGLLVRMAVAYRKKFADRVPEETLRTFIVRGLGTDFGSFLRYAATAGDGWEGTLDDGIEFEVKAWRSEMKNLTPKLRKMADLLERDGTYGELPARPRPFHAQFLSNFTAKNELYAIEWLKMTGKTHIHRLSRERMAKTHSMPWEDDRDPDVRKAVRMLTIFDRYADPNRRSWYDEDEDDDVRNLSRSMTMNLIMRG